MKFWLCRTYHPHGPHICRLPTIRPRGEVLGRAVRGRAVDRVRRVLDVLRKGERDTKVRDLYHARFVYKDVARLEVPVNNVLDMKILETSQDSGTKIDRCVW